MKVHHNILCGGKTETKSVISEYVMMFLEMFNHILSSICLHVVSGTRPQKGNI